MEKQKYYIASFSGGKDSTAMVLRLLELGEPLDEVIHCDTTEEFPAMYRHIEKVKQVVEAAGVKFTVLRNEKNFKHFLLHHKPKYRRVPELEEKVGYSWPGPFSRWCTKEMKINIINRYLRELREEYDLVQYLGLAADEGYRLERANNRTPDKAYPLAYCKGKGYDWEGLYDIFERVSCWLCPLQPLEDLRKLRRHFPELWQKLKDLDAQTWRVYKHRKSVEELDSRFELEEKLTAAGHSIKNRRFFADLKRLHDGEATIDAILKERNESDDSPTRQDPGRRPGQHPKD